MDVAAARPRTVERGEERRVLRERPVGDRAIHALEVLVEDPSRADRQVADLGVAHLAGREAHGLAGGFECAVRVLRPEPVEHGCVRELDRVPGPGRSDAPAVEDDERDERERLRHSR